MGGGRLNILCWRGCISGCSRVWYLMRGKVRESWGERGGGEGGVIYELECVCEKMFVLEIGNRGSS